MTDNAVPDTSSLHPHVPASQVAVDGSTVTVTVTVDSPHDATALAPQLHRLAVHHVVNRPTHPPVRVVKQYRIAPGARLAYADLSGEYLWMAVMPGTDLFKANLRDTNLAYADVSHSNFALADLTGAQLYQTDLTGADLRGATLAGTELSWTKLTAVTWDSHTVWPVGFIPPPSLPDRVPAGHTGAPA